MATLEELAEQYAEKLRSTTNHSYEIEQIALEIRGLVYTNNNSTPITADIRLQIADLVRTKLLHKKTIADDGRTWIAKEADNKQYLIMVQSLTAMLKG